MNRRETGRTSAPAHTASLRFSYADERRARAVERAVAVEVGEIPRAGDAAAPAGGERSEANDPGTDADDLRGGMTERSRAAVSREGAAVEVRIEAADLVALRAGANTWTRLISVAESVTESVSRETAGGEST